MNEKKLYLLQTLPEGQIIELDLQTGKHRFILEKLNTHPDGIAVDIAQSRIYWTNMGTNKEADSLEFFQADGSVEGIDLDGHNRQFLVGNGLFVTGKQLVHDAEGHYLYWCDREGMRVFRSKDDGTDVKVLVQTGLFPRDSKDYTRHCVGVAIDKRNGFIYWTQKGPSKGGKGRIFRANLAIPAGQDALTRQDVKVMIADLPEPIDLELDSTNNQMYWTDRGDSRKGGNSLNSAQITDSSFTDHRILASGLDEGIALAADSEAGHIWLTDLDGNVWKYDLAGGPLISIAKFGPLTGIAFAKF
jgi:DNA-binding beta-propeller fold protein YncE